MTNNPLTTGGGTLYINTNDEIKSSTGTTVTVGGVSCTFVRPTNYQLAVQVPSFSAGTYDIVVTYTSDNGNIVTGIGYDGLAVAAWGYNTTQYDLYFNSGSGGGVSSTTISTIVSISQADYNALADKDSSTLYVIV